MLAARIQSTVASQHATAHLTAVVHSVLLQREEDRYLEKFACQKGHGLLGDGYGRVEI